MLQIKIKNIGLPDRSSVYVRRKQYSVWLGNGITNYFTSYKDAKNYLAKANRFLNSNLYELNYLYGIIFTEYRKIWPYISESENDKILGSLETMDRNLKYAAVKSGGPNGNHFAFQFLNCSIDNIKDATRLILTILEKKKFYADLKRVESFLRQILYIRRQINDFGKVDWNEALE